MCINTFEKTRDTIILNYTKENLSGKQILEIGCETGKRTVLLVKAGCKVTSLDLVDKRKQEFYGEYNFITADGLILPFKNETFDSVVSFDVIEHINDDKKVLFECSRVTKKNGIMILGTPNRLRLSHKLRQILGKKIIYPLEVGKNCIHLREYSMEELSSLVNSVELKIIKKINIWLGLVGFPGFKYFPGFLDKYVQYLLIIARK